MSKTTQTGWKKNILEARKLRGKTAAIVYDRIQLLVATFNDSAFREDNGFDDLAAAENLDAELGDLAADFLTLRRVLELHPTRDEWAGNDLKRLVAAALEADREASKSERATPVRRATLKELDEANEKRAEAEARTKYLESELVRVRGENESLRDKLARAEGRIEELERLVKRDLAAA